MYWGSHTNHTPPDTTYWVKQDFPRLFKNYVVLSAAARLLGEDKARYVTQSAATRELERLEGALEASGANVQAIR